MYTNCYTVAGHTFRIWHQLSNIDELLPSYEIFKESNDNAAPLFTMTVDDNIQPCWQGERIGYFPCNAANFEVYRQGEEAYQILILNEYKIPCGFLQGDAMMRNLTIATRGDKEMVSFALNNALMLMYTYCTASQDTLLMHSSVVENNGKGYMFLGESGRGKSTHSDLWVKHIDGSTLINDDNPVVRISADGTPTVYGSPWSGKRPVYKKVSYPINGITAIEQSKHNKMRRESIPSAFGIMLSSCSTMKFDKRIHVFICGTIAKVLEKLPVYTLSCRPDEEAAKVSSSTLGL